jgi:sugar lactone lactonase YvrE
VAINAVETLGDFRAALGEGPIWDSRTGRVVWVDIPRGLVLVTDPAQGSTDRVAIGQPVGAVVPRLAGGYVLAVQDGFAVLDELHRRPRLVAPVEFDDRTTRMNDGKCDRHGRFWAGTMAEEETPNAGSLYRLDCDGSVTRVLDSLTVSNGMAWNEEDDRMYFIDSATGNVDVFDYDAEAGEIRGRRVLATFRPDQGVPDGLTIDEDGCLWIALWGGGSVHRLTPAGATDRVVELPASLVTSMAFGGGGLTELYVTSAAAYLSSEEQQSQPLAGSLFRVDPGVRGRPTQGFAGEL